MSLGHACVDVYQGAVAALVPFFVSERAYGYAAASGVVLAASLLSSVVQPLFGALTDRWAMPWLLPVSTLVGGAGVALSGVTGSYAATLAVVAVPGIGVAAYHPESARVARLASRGSHTAMSWFSLGGNIGFAAAPHAVAAVIATGGLRASPLLAVPAVAGAALCAAALRALRAPDAAAGPARASRGGAGRDDWPSFLRLSGAIMCRSIVFVGLSAFISLYVRERAGGGELAGTAALFVLYAGGAVGTPPSASGGADHPASRITRSTVSSSALVSGITVSTPPGSRSSGRYQSRISRSPYSSACGFVACRRSVSANGTSR
ncbi:MFS transporter [Streptomyces rugosispiralis]|uniref:MFS transporter n=1 Tax=Streptomyces rugosispiralis TaxID=2967341 RepID=A0ABT1UV76_9ACTN|nr:MFS transporter [Streptomyces rugosispiralis]MCQ8189023.1 MFS transporter [Streptomyces rugosispiralis]